MYRYLDALLKAEKEKIRTAFNRMSVTGFDELNVISTKKTTQAMYDKFVADNEAMYLKSAKNAYKKAVKGARNAGYSGEETEVDVGFLEGILTGYNLITGYLYSKETDRKRLRLNEQILTAREYSNGTMFQESLRKAANLWWTQTVQYGISTVDEATLKAFKDMGVKEVRWIAADDEKTCPECGARDNQIYRLSKVPPKPHYGCRCYVVPVEKE